MQVKSISGMAYAARILRLWYHARIPKAKVINVAAKARKGALFINNVAPLKDIRMYRGSTCLSGLLLADAPAARADA